MTAAARTGAIAAFAAGLAAQALLQGPLGRANEVRAARTLHAAPSSLAFRVAAGGVKEAAADALWLTVLPRLGRSWADPERKAAWIEAVTAVMTDANPRALTPPLYAAYFLERIRPRHPAIERVLVRAMEAEGRTPFSERRKVNTGSWELAEALGMNMYLFGGPGDREGALAWLRRAAEKPLCPTIVIDFLAAVGRRAGAPLEGWDLWLRRAETADNPGWREYFLGEADRARLEVLRQWCAEAERRRGRWPREFGEVLAAAPEAEKAEFRARPGRLAALAAEVLLHPETRDVEIPRLTARLVEEQGRQLDLLARQYEAALGVPPRTLADLAGTSPRPLPPPPLHGTRWDYDPGTREFRVVDDPEDPRRTR